MKKILKTLRRRDGSSIVIVALCMTALLTVGAIVVDLGICYLQTANLQNAADAAALAAGMNLPVAADDSTAVAGLASAAKEYLSKNHITGGYTVEPENLIDGKYTSVKISVSEQVQTSLARIIHIDHLNITRSAAAQISPSTEITGIVPLSIDAPYLQNAISTGQTQHITLKFGAGSSTEGSFGALDLDGSMGGGAKDYSSNLLNGYSGVIRVGDILSVESGNMSGPTFSSFWSRYDSCTHFIGEGGCTSEHFVSDCPRVVSVPVIQSTDSKSVTVTGFAAFVLEAGTTNGTGSYITGSFVNTVKTGTSYDKNGPGGSDDYGVYTVHLSG